MKKIEIENELTRVGVTGLGPCDTVVCNSEQENRVRLSCDSGEWEGTAEEAIRRLRLTADNAGYKSFWTVFCEGEYIPEKEVSEEENYKLYDNSLRQDRYEEAFQILVAETGYEHAEDRSWEDIYVFTEGGGTWAVGYGADESYYYVRLVGDEVE